MQMLPEKHKSDKNPTSQSVTEESVCPRRGTDGARGETHAHASPDREPQLSEGEVVEGFLMNLPWEN